MPAVASAEVGPEWVIIDSTDTSSEMGRSVAIDHDGNLIVHGINFSCVPMDPWCGCDGSFTIKMTPAGHTLWVRTTSEGNGIDPLNSPIPAPVVDASGNIYVTGPNTIKYSSTGDLLWQRPRGCDLDIDSNGNVYVLDCALSLSVVKYTPSGDTAWVRDYVDAMEVDDGGNVYCAFPNREVGGLDVIKFSTSGDTLWHYNYPEPMVSTTPSYAHMSLDDQSNVYLAWVGRVYGLDYVWEILKISSAGEWLWDRQYEYSSLSSGSLIDVAVDATGSIYLVGVTGSDYAVTLKYSPAGDLLWSNPCDSTAGGWPNALCLDAGGNVYITGHRYINSQPFTVKYAATGELLWIRRYGNSWTDPNRWHPTAESRDIVADSSGSAYVTGDIFYGNLTNLSDFLMLKYSDPVGDLDCDGVITLSDVVLLGNVIDGLIDLTGTCGGGQADVDEDGDIDDDDYNTLFDIISSIGP